MAGDAWGCQNTLVPALFGSSTRLIDLLSAAPQSDASTPNQTPSVSLIQDGDGPPYLQLLETSLVVPRGECFRFPILHAETRHTQSEIVQQAICKSIHSGQKNLLSLGYRKITTANSNGGLVDVRGIENYFPNTLANFVQSQPWTVLLSRIGREAMIYLLTETSIFVCLPNNTCFQVVGTPIFELELRSSTSSLLSFSDNIPEPAGRMAPSRALERHPSTAVEINDAEPKTTSALPKDMHPVSLKRTRSELSTDDRGAPSLKRANSGTMANTEVECRTPSEMIFKTSRIYYRNGCGRRVGLPPQHMLNKAMAIQPAKDPTGSKCLLYSIFPRLTGYKNEFTCAPPKPWEVPKPIDYVHEIKTQGLNDVPFRLKPAQVLAARMLRLHKSTNYKVMLNLYCRQVSSTIDDASEIPYMSRQASHHQVFLFLRACIKRVIPREFWGDEDNFAIFSKRLEQLVALRRFETMSLQNFLHGFKITKCSWLDSPRQSAAPPQKRHIAPQDLQKRWEILREFLYWLVNDYVISLIRFNFYVTETGFSKYRMVYFRHDVWSDLVAPHIANLGQSIFRRIEQQELERVDPEERLGFSYVRFLPKENGVRPITNMKRKFHKDELHAELQKLLGRKPTAATSRGKGMFKISINSILQNAFQILRYETSSNKEAMGVSVLGLTDIYPVLKEYALRMKRTSKRRGRLPVLYFAKVDILSAFNTIDQGLLLNIVVDLLNEDEYLVHKYTVSYPSFGKYRHSFQRRAMPSATYPQFSELAKKLAQEMKNAIFVDQVVYSYEDRERIIGRLEAHLCNNLIKMGDGFYKQVVGIPQGSIMSTILCSIYYAHMERSCRELFRDSKSLLLRFVDDFLIISPTKDRVVQFLELMYRGNPRYGAYVQIEKSLANFEIAIDGHAIPNTFSMGDATDGSEFPWCGMLINTINLNVQVDYKRLVGKSISNSLTVDLSSKLGLKMKHRLFSILRPKCHAIFLDSSLNSKRTVLINIYQNFLLAALKVDSYLKHLRRSNMGMVDGPQSSLFLTDAIREALHFYFALMRSRTQTPAALKAGCVFDVTHAQVTWLGWHAFFGVFSRKQACNSALVQALRHELDNPEFQPIQRALHSIVDMRWHRFTENIPN